MSEPEGGYAENVGDDAKSGFDVAGADAQADGEIPTMPDIGDNIEESGSGEQPPQ